VLKVAVPRPSSDAVIRGDGLSARGAAFADEEEAPVRRLTRDEAEALRRRQPALSPWRVVLAQVALGAVIATVAWMASRSELVAVSALYGAAVVALPGALMARGATSRLSSLSPLISAVSMMGWGFLKMATAVAMLVLAPRIVPGLVWPAMLATLVVCLQTYWLALLWRGRSI
jgi:ATP synthase protein I